MKNVIALDVKMKTRLWTPNWKKTALNDKRKANNGSERQNETMALNAKWKKYDSTGRRNETTALNTKLEKNGFERQNENE